MRDAANKAARLVINHCLKNGIGTLVFGWNTGQKYGEKPERWKESGRRLTRGMYKSKDGIRINADCNGAANILRKVAVNLRLNLEGISRGVLTSPYRIPVATCQTSA
jgi:transposase